ncbi:zinc finger protein 862-like [Rhizophagus clarus]|nr:zinc finger protein 862-like [Rhizophagus clarus]
MVDESTDISSEPHLIIYVKYCLHGKIKVRFLKLLQLKSKDSKTIFEAIIDLFDKKGLTNKLMSFASDGASVMLGRSTGVASRIKERNECLFITHCIAHRLALACNSAEKKVDFCKHAEHIIKSVYNFFSNSSKRVDILRKYQEILGHPILKIKQIYEVRWLSCFVSLYTAICNWKLLAFLHFLWDILGYLSALSKVFQQKKIQISDIDPVIELTLNKIRQEFLEFDNEGRLLLGENLNRFLSNVPLGEDCNIGAHQLTWDENYEAELVVDIQSFASAVVSEIQERFPDRPLLNSMKILDHANWPNCKEELAKYGEQELNILSEFYKKEVNNICGEWFGYKAIVYSNFKNIKIEVLLPRLFEFYYDAFPNIIKLLGIIYSIPFSSVDCERGFSKQNLIKTDLRNSLNNETLHFWMMVGLEEKDLSEFDFTRALQIWNGACKRRI